MKTIPNDAVGPGDVQAMYPELRRIAGFHTRRCGGNPTLQPTILVHEAWIRLSSQRIRSRTQYLALASKAMRHLVVDYFRSKTSQKRAGVRVPLEEGSHATADISHDQAIEIDRLLKQLSREDPRKARVVEMLFFEGMNFPEIASALNVSLITVKRDWQFCRAWLGSALSEAA